VDQADFKLEISLLRDNQSEEIFLVDNKLDFSVAHLLLMEKKDR